MGQFSTPRNLFPSKKFDFPKISGQLSPINVQSLAQIAGSMANVIVTNGAANLNNYLSNITFLVNCQQVNY